MATQAQYEANRLNAQQSTGPRTDAGKAATAQNALKHGFCAVNIVLPDEDPAAFQELADQLRAELSPDGALQEILFQRITTAAWRLGRALSVEQGFFQRHQYDRPAANFPQRIAEKFSSACRQADSLGKLSRYENAMERSLHKCLVALRAAQATNASDKKLRNKPNSATTS